MRQAGFIAACGIYALDHHITRLKEDNKKAAELGKVIANLAVVESVMPVESNIVIFNLNDKISGAEFEKKLAAHNIRISAFGKQTVRMVTHLDFTDDMLNETIRVLKAI